MNSEPGVVLLRQSLLVVEKLGMVDSWSLKDRGASFSYINYEFRSTAVEPS
ncbi:MAG: hypothetical protein WBE13_10970 [Candidatus Acidiferrum sp.]